MNSSTLLTAATAAASPSAVANNSQPPIIYFFQLLQQILSGTLTFTILVSRTFASAAGSILSPVSAVSSPILYILAPIFVLANILLEVLILTPYHVVAYLLHAVYPIYVLVGTAFLCAGLVGLCARFVIYTVNGFLPHSPSIAPAYMDMRPEEKLEKPRRKPVKKVSIKEERHS